MTASKERREPSGQLIKSKKRVEDHGEVFTPTWLVETMLDLTTESERIDSRFLESACGNGNFLIRILERKLAIIELRRKKTNREKRILALIAVMSIYGIELLEDNIVECRKRLLSVVQRFLNIAADDEIYRAASRVLSLNLIHGDALKMLAKNNQPIVFSEWTYLGSNKFQRQDFRFDELIGNKGNLLPSRVYSSMNLEAIANARPTKIHEESL